jgi:hypothetical protein
MDEYNVYVDGTQANVTYEGLAPGFAGLYQVNFVVPNTPDTGPVYVDFEDTVYGAYTSMATMVVSNISAAVVSPDVKSRPSKARIVRRGFACQESFGVTNDSPTRAKCASAGTTRRVDRNLRPPSVGTSPNGE